VKKKSEVGSEGGGVGLGTIHVEIVH